MITAYCFRLTIGACVLWMVSGQYHAQYRNSNDQQYHHRHHPSQQQQQQQQQQQRLFAPDPTTPHPLIISHKQQLTHDGGFNYAFAADNGLQQGESIAPDGTRAGTYSYRDPTGKQITVKYTAGKEGFRILDGDHVPRQQPQSNTAENTEEEEQEQRPRYTAATAAAASNAGPQTFYSRPAIVQQTTVSGPLPRYLTYKNQSPDVNAIQPEPEYNDEPGSPHSFGNGYVFEFGG